MHSFRRSQVQRSEAFSTMAFLTLSGGLQDAYTYFVRDGVFANAQTGNIVLMSVRAFSGDLAGVLRYLIPLTAFALGVFAAEMLRQRERRISVLHWRQLVVLAEILLLFLVGFLPPELNPLANALVSFTCAMQVQAFRKVHGYPFASTMCIGNLRSGMDSLVTGLRLHDRKALNKAAHYFAVIVLFALGAGVGAQCVSFLGLRTIWISCLLLCVSLCLMFRKETTRPAETH